MANFIRDLMIGLIKSPVGVLLTLASFRCSPIFAFKHWFPTFVSATERCVYDQAVTRVDTLRLCLSCRWETVDGNHTSVNAYQKKDKHLYLR